MCASPASLFCAVTLVAAAASCRSRTKLRYYMHWMLTLVAFNLLLWSRDYRFALAPVAVVAFLIVSWSTGFGYLYASGNTFAAFLPKHVDESVIDAALPGTRLCIEKPPFTVLYAPEFHPGKPYTVQEKAAAADCR